MARPKKVSMQDIADQLGISKNAVSLALSGKSGVSEQVRLIVRHKAEEMGYVPPGAAAKPEASSRNILLLVPERVVSHEDSEHFRFFHDMLWILEETVRAHGCSAVIVRIDRQMEERLELPSLYGELEHIGVILFGIIAKPYAHMVWETGVPLVMLDSYYRDMNCAAAVSANTEGAESVVRLLIERGHRQIGFIGPANLTTSHEERWFGYWRAMREAGLPIDERMTLLEADDFDEVKNEQQIGAFLARLVATDALPTAFFCGNDRIALLLIRRLRAIGISVPEQMKVAGFDGLEQACAPDSGLYVTIRADKKQMCRSAVRLLLDGYGEKRHAVRWTTAGQLIPVSNEAGIDVRNFTF
ncbi:LacI family DNA-binding transcriptional regulator [Saccharibacillus endophyticus]|uniref:LacI family transcriptional regulator n=1 Tax=Saccharibacillus endophyticus TaxID=2060666 RepID=A0ABQ1ZUN4_9BACL|nr:LacI family DNA-binding transcriptional regulator [Saccharibacillus endophyticus]GGH79107.1 LacI family transcriptional regulator [Saccharibacillus endophyticus]